MSLITRCPACQTAFRVVPDQLRISEGWVRCGQCEEIFDGSLHLQADASFAEPEPAEPAPVDLPPPAVDEKLPAPAFIERLLRPKTDPWSPITVEEMAQFKPKVEQFESMQDEWQEELKEAAQEEWLKEPLESVSFLQETQTKPVWRHTWVRAGLALVCLSLLAVLALQIAVHERNRLAVFAPETKSALGWICELTGCVVSPLQQIDSIVIDSSTFSKIRGDTYRLGLVIKNTAALELALPALELTLTDSQDQPTLRRVFTPAEIGASSKVLAANAEWSTAIALNIRSGAGAERFTGYRVLAFYP